MNINECMFFLREAQFLIGKMAKYEGQLYKIEEVIAGPDSDDFPLVAIDYLLNGNIGQALKPYSENEDLELFIYCKRVGFDTPLIVKLNEVEIM